MAFEWQTEEAEWPDEIPPEPSEPRRPWLRRGLLALIVISLVTTGGYFLSRQFGKRVAEVEDTLRAEVIASHKLVRLAAAQQDDEIFVTVLSGRDSEWVSLQRELVREGALLDRAELGLLHVAGREEPTVVDVTFAADLTEAVLTTREEYAVNVGNGLTDTIALEHRAVYRQGPGRWLYSPPLETPDFSWDMSEGRRLTLTYPDSEATLALRLAQDLEGWLAELCALPGLACGPDLHLSLRLDPASESLLVDGSLATISDAGGEMTLPAFTTLGMPIDEEAYDAVSQAYGRYVTTAALLQAFKWECCERGTFTAATVTAILAQLGLQPRLLSEADYDALLAEPAALADLQSLWRSEHTVPSLRDQRLILALFGFLSSHEAGTSTVDLVRTLYETPSYWDWIRRFMPGDLTDREVERAWLAYLVGQASAEAQEAPLDLPEEDLALLCTSARRNVNWDLYRYDVTEKEWSPALEDESFVSLVPWPGANDVALVQANIQDTSGPAIRLWRWSSDETEPVWESEVGELLFFYNLTDPGGGHLYFSARDLQQRKLVWRSFNLAACDMDDCAAVDFFGIPVFSPDNEHALVLSGAVNGLALALTNKSGEVVHELGFAYQPFWLDADTFGYVQEPPGDGATIMTASVAAPESASVLLNQSDLVAGLADDPSDMDVASYRVDAIAPVPEKPHLLFVSLSEAESRRHHIISYDLRTGTATERLQLRSGLRTSPALRFSPDGSWLVVTAFAEPDRGQLYLHQVEEEETHTYPLRLVPYGLAWSPDGNWLAVVDEMWVTLVAPEHQYNRIDVHDLLQCGPAGWIDAGAPNRAEGP